jgi:hypothetical protein
LISVSGWTDLRATDREADTGGITLLGEPWGVGSSQRSDRQAGWVLRGEGAISYA